MFLQVPDEPEKIRAAWDRLERLVGWGPIVAARASNYRGHGEVDVLMPVVPLH